MGPTLFLATFSLKIPSLSLATSPLSIFKILFVINYYLAHLLIKLVKCLPLPKAMLKDKYGTEEVAVESSHNEVRFTLFAICYWTTRKSI